MALRTAVTLRRSDASSYEEPRDALARDWVPLFEALNLVPILVPSSMSDPVALASDLGAEALLLTGGESVGEDGARDQTEARLFTWALEARLPTVGVCRGLHMIQSLLGGRLEPVELKDDHVATSHSLEVAREIECSQPAQVNSFHAYRIGEPQPELRVMATAPDGTIELVAHESLPVRAAQFHPERPGCEERLVQWLFHDLGTTP